LSDSKHNVVHTKNKKRVNPSHVMAPNEILAHHIEI